MPLAVFCSQHAFVISRRIDSREKERYFLELIKNRYYDKNIINRKRDFLMFLDNLSASILQLCSLYEWSYETASEQCNLSSRYFGDIARKKTSPSIATLEKICTGFALTPNDLLLEPNRELKYRIPMKITRIRYYGGLDSSAAFPVCPRCEASISRDYQGFCDCCGQRLNWEHVDKAIISSSRNN